MCGFLPDSEQRGKRVGFDEPQVCLMVSPFYDSLLPGQVLLDVAGLFF